MRVPREWPHDCEVPWALGPGLGLGLGREREPGLEPGRAGVQAQAPAGREPAQVQEEALGLRGRAGRDWAEAETRGAVREEGEAPAGESIRGEPPGREGAQGREDPGQGPECASKDDRTGPEQVPGQAGAGEAEDGGGPLAPEEAPR